MDLIDKSSWISSIKLDAAGIPAADVGKGLATSFISIASTICLLFYYGIAVPIHIEP